MKSMSRWFLAICAVGAVLAMAVSLQAAPTGYLQMSSDPGDYVGAGLTYSFTHADGDFTAYRSSLAPDGKPFSLMIAYREPSPGHWWYLNFSTAQLGHSIRPGAYYNAERASFASPGHPGLDVYGDGRGSNQLTGFFVISECSWSPANKLEVFRASFTQYCYGSNGALRGTVYYNNAPPVPDVAGLATSALGLAVATVARLRVRMRPLRR